MSWEGSSNKRKEWEMVTQQLSYFTDLTKTNSSKCTLAAKASKTLDNPK
jgi:hypothetical protein